MKYIKITQIHILETNILKNYNLIHLDIGLNKQILHGGILVESLKLGQLPNKQVKNFLEKYFLNHIHFNPSKILKKLLLVSKFNLKINK